MKQWAIIIIILKAKAEAGVWQQRQWLAVAVQAGNAVNWRQIAGLDSRCGGSAGADRYSQGSLPHHPPTRLSQFHGGLVVRVS